MEGPRAQEGIGRPVGELGPSLLCFVLGLCGSHPKFVIPSHTRDLITRDFWKQKGNGRNHSGEDTDCSANPKTQVTLAPHREEANTSRGSDRSAQGLLGLCQCPQKASEVTG